MGRIQIIMLIRVKETREKMEWVGISNENANLYSEGDTKN